jgi:hypothetical protein
MKDTKVLVGFRVDAAFNARIEAEALKRDMTKKDMIILALKIFFQTPRSVDWDWAEVNLVKFEKPGEEDEFNQRSEHAALFWKYLDEMPPEKIDLLMRAMRWDLLAKKSSRRKLDR